MLCSELAGTDLMLVGVPFAGWNSNWAVTTDLAEPQVSEEASALVRATIIILE